MKQTVQISLDATSFFLHDSVGKSIIKISICRSLFLLTILMNKLKLYIMALRSGERETVW